MQYSVQLSQRAVDIIGNVCSPSKKQIKQKRTKETVYGVGVHYTELQKTLGLSIWQLRRTLQRELYGLVGVFFGNFEGHHSSVCHDENLSSTRSDALIDEIHGRKHEAMFTYSGKIVETTPKKVSRHYGLYVPEQIRTQVSTAFDAEGYLFNGEISNTSLPILEFILRRSLELREKHGNNWYPYFSDNSISKATNIPVADVESATKDLTGLICECHQMKQLRVWQKRLFLPSSRFEIIETLLANKR